MMRNAFRPCALALLMCALTACGGSAPANPTDGRVRGADMATSGSTGTSAFTPGLQRNGAIAFERSTP